MKRFFFSAIALVVAASACTESGLIETPDFYANGITFEPYIGKAPVTKAESIDEAYLMSKTTEGAPAFHVYAFLHNSNVENATGIKVTKPFMDKDVWYDTRDNVWRYDGLEYWPEGQDTYLAFVAYNSDAEDCITSHPTPTKFEFTVPDVVEDQVDLLITDFMPWQWDSNPAGNTEVNLVFKHLLSRVGFSVIATNPTQGVDIAIRSIKFYGDFYSTGTVDLAPAASVGSKESPSLISPVIEKKAGTEVSVYSLFDSEHCFEASSYDCKPTTVTVGENEVTIPGKPIFPNVALDLTATDWEDRYEPVFNSVAESTAAENDRYMMLIPGELGDNAYIEVEYQLTSDIKRTAKVQLQDWELLAGFAYEFVLKVSTNSIEFEADMSNGWSDSVAPTGSLVPLS